MVHQSVRNYVPEPVPYKGAVDADGHVLEPADLWEHYLEDEYKDRAIRVRVNEEGLEYLEVDGELSSTPGWISPVGSMGKDGPTDLDPDYKYMENMPYGACDPTERAALLKESSGCITSIR